MSYSHGVVPQIVRPKIYVDRSAGKYVACVMILVFANRAYWTGGELASILFM